MKPSKGRNELTAFAIREMTSDVSPASGQASAVAAAAEMNPAEPTTAR